MGWVRSSWLFVAALTLAGCSMASTIENLAGEAGKREAFALLDALCAADQSPLKPRFDEKLWAESAEQLTQVRQYCPDANAKKQIVGYQTETSSGTSGSFSQKAYTVVADSNGRWTTATFTIRSENGGPEKILAWNINASQEKPGELAALEMVDTALPWMGGAILLVFLVLVVAIIRYVSKRNALRQQP